MKKKSTATTPAVAAEIAKPEMQTRLANSHKTYQFIRFQDHSHGRQFKSPFSVNHEPGIY